MVAVFNSDWQIRAMGPDDLDQVMAIELVCYDYPWRRSIFQDCLRAGYRCRVLADEASQQGVVGYGLVSEAADEAHLLNVCIHPEARRHGLGELLVTHLMRESSVAGMQRFLLEVRPSNSAGRALYRKLGFRAIGRRPGYYPADQGREDALVLMHDLADLRFQG